MFDHIFVIENLTLVGNTNNSILLASYQLIDSLAHRSYTSRPVTREIGLDKDSQLIGLDGNWPTIARQINKF